MEWTQTCRPDDLPSAAVADAGQADPATGTLPPLDRLVLTELVLPEQSNHYGTLFGPNGLALMGKAAYLVATRFTRQAIVMVGANRIAFQRPAPVGALLRIDARITRVGRSSLTAQVVACFDAAPGTRAEPVLSGDFEMVAVDERGRPTPITAPALDARALAELSVAAARG
ncbi:MAG: acyl-CoA thioesterase [Methylibium sp.]|nr:acyl-CoA thioesterase [Methylibium sp.]